MALPITRYELDTTGQNRSNLVEGEIHTLSSRDLRAAAPRHGPYFKESMIVYDNVKNTPLKLNVDYICTELMKEATLRIGKEICCIVLIINKEVSSQIRLTYQAVGGKYTNQVDEMITLYETAMSDKRPVEWTNVLNKPYAFPPALHSHLLRDVVGFEPLIDAIDRLGRCITMSNVPAFEYLIEYLNTEIVGFEERLLRVVDRFVEENIEPAIRDVVFHITRKDNPHEVTKEQVGLGLVENLALATDLEVETGLRLDKYITLKQLVDYVAISIETAIMSMNKDYTLRDGVLEISIATTNIETNRLLYWKIVHISTDDECFVRTTGSVGIYNNRGRFTIATSFKKLPDVGEFKVILTRSEDGQGKVYDTTQNIKYTNELSDNASDFLAFSPALREELTAEGFFYSEGINNYTHTRHVVSDTRILIEKDIEHIEEFRLVKRWLYSNELGPEEMYLDLVDGFYDATRGINGDF